MNMEGMDKKHQVLLALLVLFIVLQVLLAFGLFAPHRQELEDVRDGILSMRTRLKSDKWPQDARKLAEYLDSLRMELDGKGRNCTVMENAKRAFERCDVTFRQAIKVNYGSTNEFVANVSRLDYQSEFNRVVSALAEKKIQIRSSVLNLSEESSSPNTTYQNLLHIWTVERLALLAMNSKLSIPLEAAAAATVTRGKKAGGEKAAAITALPVKAYCMTEKDARPYLLEFPVAISLVGSLVNCMDFIDSLTAEDNFIPVTAFEIFALPPDKITAAEDGMIAEGKLLMKLQCSAFLNLKL